MAWSEAPTQFTRRNIFWDILGEEKTGKTTLGLTIPGDLGVIDLNRGLDGVVQKAVARRKKAGIKGRVRVSACPLPDGEEDSAKCKAEALKVWKILDADMRVGFKSMAGMVTDSGTEFYKLARMCSFGDVKSKGGKGQLDYDEVYRRMRFLLNQFHANKASLVMTHQLKDEWVSRVDQGTGKVKSSKTGKLVRDGFDEIGYMAQIVVRTSKRIDKETGLVFVGKVESCRFNADIEGAEFTNEGDVDSPFYLTLPHIAAMATDTDIEEWL